MAVVSVVLDGVVVILDVVYFIGAAVVVVVVTVLETFVVNSCTGTKIMFE